MTATRLNAGKQNGTFLAQLGAWNLLQTADGRYKVASIALINGKANYAFGVRADGRLDTHLGLDCAKLSQDRPDLFKACEAYFKEKLEADKPKDEETDPYGDLAMSRRRKLTPEQNWCRGLLQMRRIEFEHAAAKRDSVWESGVRMLWAGVFGTKIADNDLQTALHWITQRQGEVDLPALLQLEQDYYAGKFQERPCERLAEALDRQPGSSDYENVEETNAGSNGQEAQSLGADNTEADPFSAFR